jgi:hypothetical protein
VAFESVVGAVPPRYEAHARFAVRVERTEHGQGRHIDEENRWNWGVAGMCEVPPLQQADVTGNATMFRIVGLASKPASEPAAREAPLPWALAALVGALVVRARRPSWR